MNQIKTRSLISYEGICPMNCKHCYTYELAHPYSPKTHNELLDEIESESSDVIYISRKKENFFNEEEGLRLTVDAYHKFSKHMLIITRKTLSDRCIQHLKELTIEMNQHGHMLAIAVSIPANDSYGITEDSTIIASPEERCNLLRRLHEAHIPTIFMARPLFPNTIIPTKELIDLISKYSPYIDSVVSSGLAVNDAILQRLGFSGFEFNYLPGNHKEYLIGSEADNIKYIDVSTELEDLKAACTAADIPFFTHSMEALNHLLSRMSFIAD